MTYLHIMAPYTTRPYHVIKFIKTHFTNDEHKFLMMATRDYIINRNPRLLAFTDLIYEPKIQKKKCSKLDRLLFLKELMDNADCIVWHSLIRLRGKMFLPLAVKEKYLKKSVWVRSMEDADYTKKAKGRYNKTQHKARKNMMCIALPIGAGYGNIRRLYGKNKCCVPITMPLWPSHFEALKNEICFERENNKTIIVGIDGRPTNRHIEIINSLKQIENFDGYNVMMPMNYAMLYEYGISNNSSYIRRVKRTAKYALEKTPIILDKGGVDEETYFRLINTSCAAVFAGNCPLSCDLVLYLFALGKKIFMPANSPFALMLTNLGFYVYNFNIGSKNHVFMDFYNYDNEIKQNNINVALNILDENNIAKQWENLFETASRLIKGGRQ